jgi:CheY-like chemotaxis protein
MARTAVLIDDDQEDLDLIQSALQMNRPEIHCITFSSPLDAIKALTYELLIPPEFIFIDINMPQMRGNECLCELRRLPQYDGSVITILSTSVGSAERVNLKESGATYVFEKPAQFDDLRKILKQIIQ